MAAVGGKNVSIITRQIYVALIGRFQSRVKNSSGIARVTFPDVTTRHVTPGKFEREYFPESSWCFHYGINHFKAFLAYIKLF